MSKELLLDLRNIPKDGGDVLADSPAFNAMSHMLLDYAGKYIRVKITVLRRVNDGN